ncbi:zinc finger protein 415-like [Odocoileus virginianus]|uniref:Zinc finger protein 415-like n=1 Tax=Odocoileus virginianus TaxID=9874 RepID=A0A6J0VKQ2_ODOVR
MPGPCSEGLVQGHDAGDLEEPALCGYLYNTCGQPITTQSRHDTGEVFQTAILGRPKTHEIKHFYFREIQEDMYDFECHCRSGGRNNKGMPITHGGNLTDDRGQQCRKYVEIKSFVNRLGLNMQDKLQIFQTDGIISECNEVMRSVNSSLSLSPLQGISPSVQTNLSNIFGNDFLHPLLLTQDPTAYWKRASKYIECRKSFSHVSALRNHQIIYLDEILHKCDICVKVFSTNSHLAVHQRIHKGEKPHKCDECGKVFSHRTTLANNQRIHTGEKPFKCNECGRSFNCSSNLSRHQIIHIGYKLYKCDVCGSDFSQKSNLIDHQRVHSGEKQSKVGEGYKCNFCGKLFSHSSHLLIRQRIPMGEKPYKCNQCRKDFSEKATPAKHQSN